MSARSFSNFGFEYYEKGRSIVEDKFVGRHEGLALFSEIVEYPRRGKEMPALIVRGIAGSGKSWLLARFAAMLESDRLPYVAYNLRSPIAGNIPGAWVRFSREIADRYNLRTPRFNRVKNIFDLRFRGNKPEEQEENTGFIKGLFKTFTGSGQSEEIPSPKMCRIYGKDWEKNLSSRPLHEHLNAMAVALAEDIDYELDGKKFPFMTVLLDSWNISTERQAPLWKALADNCSRLFVIIASQMELEFSDAKEITLHDFNEKETREALERRGIGSPQAIANIMGETGGSPLTVSLAASLAELLARKGDIIRANSFSVQTDEDVAENYMKKIWEHLRDSEQYALCATVKSPGLPPELLAELHAQRVDLPAGAVSASEYIPCEPPFSAETPVKVHLDIYDVIEELSHTIHTPNIADLSRRVERLLESENLLEWEILDARLNIHLAPENALAGIIERIMAMRASGEFTAAESLWRCSHPEGNLGLATIHRMAGYELLHEYLSGKELETYFSRETDTVVTDAEYTIEHSRLISSDNADDALRELQDCVGSLSSAITETSGKEPTLWYLRGEALLLASQIMYKSGVYKEVLSSAQKAFESFNRTIQAELDTAGLVSIECARACGLAADAENGLGETKMANSWLLKALDSLDNATSKRVSFTADIDLIRATAIFKQGEILLKKENRGEAEECFTLALEELGKIAKGYRMFDAISAQKSGEIYISLARLLQQTGAQESAMQALNDAGRTYDKYEELIGGGDYLIWIGRGKIALIEAEIYSTDSADTAITRTREAIEYFERAWEASGAVEAVEGEIDALIFEADLLCEEKRDYETVFDRVEEILETRLSGHASRIKAVFKWIKLAKSRGRAAYIEGKNDIAAKHFSDAIHGYADLNEISSDLPEISDLAEIHLATAVAWRAGGEPVEAFKSLKRALESFEMAADKNTERGRKRVLHAAIGVYNDLSASGMVEESFEASLFALALIAQVGGQEAISIGHELLVYWESQDLSFREKHKLEEVASTLQEYWGQ